MTRTFVFFSLIYAISSISQAQSYGHSINTVMVSQLPNYQGSERLILAQYEDEDYTCEDYPELCEDIDEMIDCNNYPEGECPF